MVGNLKKSASQTGKTAKRRNTSPKSMAKLDPNLPAVSKQTAAGIVGATIGGMIAGPIGAVAGGVAGAMVGNAAAEGHHPIETAVNQVAAVTKKPLEIVSKRVKSAVTSAIGTTNSRSSTKRAKTRASATPSAKSRKAKVSSKAKARS